MSNERLSKLQKEILACLYRYEQERGRYSSKFVSHYGLKTGVASVYRDTGENEIIQGILVTRTSKNYDIVFCQSLRNLEKKKLVKLIYCYQLPKWGFHSIKICDGKKPSEQNPCDNCPYLEKFGCSYNDLSVYDGKCSFMVKAGKRGKEGYKQRVHDIELTDKGKKILFKTVQTPKIIREAKKEAEFRINFLEENGFLEDETFEHEFNRILEEKTKTIIK